MKNFMNMSIKNINYAVMGFAPLLFLFFSHMSFLEEPVKRILFLISLLLTSLLLFVVFSVEVFQNRGIKKSSFFLLLVVICIYGHSSFYPPQYEYGLDKLSYIYVVIFLVLSVSYLSFYNSVTIKGFIYFLAFFSIYFCFLSIFLGVDENNLRKSSIGLNPTIMSKACLILAIFSTAKILAEKNKNNLKYFIFIFISFIAIVKTGSRGVVVSYFLSFTALYYFLNGLTKSLKVVFIIPLLCLMIYMLLGFLPEELSSRYSLESVSIEENSDDGDRIQLWGIALLIMKSNFWGIGSGNFLNYSFVAVPHNFLLEIAVEYGVIASLLSLMVLIYSFYNMKKSIKNYHNFSNIFFCFLFLNQIVNSMLGGELSIQSLLLYVCIIYFSFKYYKKLV